MDMDDSALTKLSAEQMAALANEHKAIFCTLDEVDQAFFAKTFSPKDLPGALLRKAEIMKREQSRREKLEKFEAVFAENSQDAPSGADTADSILTGVGAVVGVGAAAAMVATDNTAFFQGVQPSELVAPLRTEFQTNKTGVNVTGKPEAMEVTVFLNDSGRQVPAMTVNLTSVNDGCEVKVNNLTQQGIIQTLKQGGQKLLGLAGKGLDLLKRGKSGELAPEDLLSGAGITLEEGANLAESVGALKLKERAWKVIKQTAEAIEVNFKDLHEKETQARYALENAWDNYYNCPNCGVSFADGDKVCRVCGTARPEPPSQPDPRKL
jgi:hypothetical protein